MGKTSQPFLTFLLLLAALLPASGLTAVVQSPDLPDPNVRVTEQSGTLTLNISFRVPVTPRQAWDVLTDFEHMSDFIPNLETSQVLLRTAKTVQVEQKGRISLGMLPIPYQSTRLIELTPYQLIRSHALSGNTRLDSVMVLTTSGTGTLLNYSATAVPDLPVPSSLVSSYMGEMLEHQFKAMGKEMLRRAAADDKSDEEDEPQPGQSSSGKPAPSTSQQTGKPIIRQASPKPSPTQLNPKPKQTKASSQAKKRPD